MKSPSMHELPIYSGSLTGGERKKKKKLIRSKSHFDLERNASQTELSGGKLEVMLCDSPRRGGNDGPGKSCRKL